jgi:hypothetical protein
VYTPPYTSPLAYTINGIPSDSSTHTIRAIFQEYPACSIYTQITTPMPCNTSSLYTGNYSSIKISPNPVHDRLFIEIPNDQMNEKSLVAVYDIQGRPLNIQPVVPGKNVVDFSSLSDGVYVVKISGSRLPVIRRIIKN